MDINLKTVHLFIDINIYSHCDMSQRNKYDSTVDLAINTFSLQKNFTNVQLFIYIIYIYDECKTTMIIQ